MGYTITNYSKKQAEKYDVVIKPSKNGKWADRILW